MKKIMTTVCMLIIIVVLTACTANPTDQNGTSPSPEQVTVQAQVVDIENGLLVIGQDEYLQGLCHVGGQHDLDNITTGDIISITFDGMVAESYPSQIGNVTDISLVESKGDIIGVYREAFAELRVTDSGLDADADIIALDLTQINNLNSQAKGALVYLISSDTGMSDMVYESTFEELKQEGLITEDQNGFIQFERGVLYTISCVEVPSGFTFDIEKFRSSLGAYGFSDCTATLIDGEFVWGKGDEWIS